MTYEIEGLTGAEHAEFFGPDWYEEEQVEVGVDEVYPTEVVNSLAEALRAYLRLDNDRRAGCQIEAADWAECHQMGIEALSKLAEVEELKES